MLKILKSKRNKIILSALVLVIMVFPLLASAGWNMPNKPNGLPNKALDEVIMDITDWVLGFAGIIAILVIVYGGLLYLTSAGNEDQMEKGKKTLMWGILGLVIIGISYAIVKVIVDVWLKA